MNRHAIDIALDIANGKELPRPRTFLWHSVLGIPFPMIVFDDPRVGCADLVPMRGTEIKLDPDDKRTLTHLAADHPAPILETV